VLTPRRFIILTITLAVFSILWSCWTLIRDPDSGGQAMDSWGTRALGHRAVFDTLIDVGLPVRRQLSPPRRTSSRDQTLVFWDPRPDLVELEAAWFGGVAEWVRAGGHVVVATTLERRTSWLQPDIDDGSESPDDDDGPDSGREKSRRTGRSPEPRFRPGSLLELLGLKGVRIVAVHDPAADDELKDRLRSWRDPLSVDEIRDVLAGGMNPRPTVGTVNYPVTVSGSLADSLPRVRSMELRAHRLHEIQVDQFMATGTVTVSGADPLNRERAVIVMADLPVGRGHVTLISTPSLTANVCVGKGDNIVAVTGLLAAGGPREIVFDEFFHGATIRGNPLWLASRRTYGTVAATLILLTGLLVWRHATYLGPPLAVTPSSRRSLHEYVEAMSRFVTEGRGHRGWIIDQLREGVLWSVRREYHLPPEDQHVAEPLQRMSRREPGRAARLEQVLAELSAARSQPLSSARYQQLITRITECLSKTDTPRSAPKSKKSSSGRTK